MASKRVLIVFPNAWDRKQLESCRKRWEGRYEIVWGEPTDESCPWDYDVLQYIERMVNEHVHAIQGVTSSSDYPGATVAGAIASGLGLPGSPPETVIRTSHKYYSRLVQQEVVPEATPGFELVDPRHPNPQLETVSFPCFIKPVKGAFSVMSRRLDSPAEFIDFLRRPAVEEFATHYVHIFNQLVAGLTSLEVDGSYFLAEELLRGRQATVEGFVSHGRVKILGVVDSIQHPDTGSFVRFDYPSALPLAVQGRMGEIAERAIAALGLADTFFNIEMIYEPGADRLGIIEINPRICGQFADLYQKVDGRSSYELALDLAVGDDPVIPARVGEFAAASSYPLRIFQPMRVAHAPELPAIGEVEAASVGTLVWSECETGQLLKDFESLEDGRSYRYGLVNLGGANRADLDRRLNEVLASLDFHFEPL